MPKDTKKTPESRSEERAKNYPNLRPRAERDGRVIVTAPSRDTLESAESALERVTSTENPRIRRAVRLNSLTGPSDDLGRGSPEHSAGGPPENLIGSPSENIDGNPSENNAMAPSENVVSRPLEKLSSDPSENLTTGPSEDIPCGPSENLTSGPPEVSPGGPSQDLPPSIPPKVDDASNDAPCKSNVDQERTEKHNLTEVSHDSTTLKTPEPADSTVEDSAAKQCSITETTTPPNLETVKSIAYESDYDEMIALAEAVASTEKVSDTESKDEGSTTNQPKAEEAPK